MDAQHEGAEVPSRLAAAWPPVTWAGVNVLAAVSGGADSMALLRALADLKCRAGGSGQLLAGHVNHGVRGEASDEDERWVCQQCREVGVEPLVRRTDATSLAAAEGDGLEAAARNARYRLLTEMAERAGARYVVTAHTRDDQVETVLFRLFRGAGLRGLAGMRPSRPLSPSVALVRPLLDVTRRELEIYLNSLGQTWREDGSNHDLSFARNRLRHELVPYLREHFNADADQAIARTAQLASEAQQLVDQLAQELLARSTATPASPRGIELAVAPLAGQPPLVVREALRQAWRQAELPEQAMTNRWWRQLTQLALATEARAVLNLPGNVLATRAGDRLVLAPRQLP